MADEFTCTDLGRLLSFSNGRSSPVRAGGLPYPVYGSNGVIGHASESNAEANSIVIGRVGSYCGSLYLSNNRCWVTDNAIRANARKGNDARFLFYLLGTLRLNNWRAGSGQPLLNQEILGRIPAAVPELQEQRAIAHILGTLDDKIELTRRTNETLEAIARALFKSWFVDFDPVRAKAEGLDPGLPQPLADLFPDSFEDSELGEIPKGWGTRSVGEILGLDKGLSYKGQFLTEQGIPMINLGCFLGRGRFRAQAIKNYSGEYKARHVVRQGDLVLANTDITQQRTVLGSPALVPTQGGLTELIFSHHVFAARFKADAEDWKMFIYFLLLQDDFRERAAGYATGTTVLALPREAVLKASFPDAPKPLVAAFAKVALSNLQREWEQVEGSRALATLRDTLLPRLISGELRMTDATQFARNLA